MSPSKGNTAQMSALEELPLMKLIYYELKKVLSKRVFLIILPLCLVINVFLLYRSQTSDEYNSYYLYSNEYNTLIDEYAAYEAEEGYALVTNELDAYTIANYMDLLAQAEDESEALSYEQILESYAESSPEAYAQAEELNSSGGSVNTWELQFLYIIQSQYEYIESYPSFISEMYDRAEKQSSVSVFGDSSSFSNKNLYKTAEDYAHLENITLTIGNGTAVTELSSYTMADWFVIAIVFMSCVYLFSYERDKGLLSIVRSTKNGRLATAVSKVTALFIITAAVSLVFFAADFATLGAVYGTGDLSRSIQSISDFRNCAYALSVWQYLAVTALVKAMAMASLAAVVAMVFVLLSSPALTYLLCVVIAAAEYLLYTLIDSTSSLNLLKYINIFYLMDSGELIGTYRNLNIFSNALTAVNVQLIVWAAVFAVCSVLTCVRFTVHGQVRKTSVVASLLERIKTRFGRMRGSTKVFAGETYKFLFQNRMAVLILLLIVYCVYSSFGTVRYTYEDESDASYKTYMEYLEGELTDEKAEYIAEQQEYMDGLRARQADIANDTEISDSAKSIMLNSINNTLSTEGAALERVQTQYARLLELQSQGVAVAFIDENIYESFVSNAVREWNNFTLLIVALIIALPSIFTCEYKTSMIYLIRPTKHGKLPLYSSKLWIAFITLVISFAAVYTPYFVRFVRTFGTGSMSTPLACLSDDLSDTALTILSAQTIKMAGYFAAALAAAAVILMLSVLLKGTLAAMTLSSVLLLIPSLALYSAESVRVGYLVRGKNTVGVVLVFAVSVALAVLAAVYTGMRFTNFKVSSCGGVLNS